MADGSEDNGGVTYKIVFEKDHASVKVTYNVSTTPGGPVLIADFQLTVDGADLISNFPSGQTAVSDVKFHTLAKPDQDATVSFTLSSNQGFTTGDNDVLRGDHTFDDAEFEG